ncbi:hypothetical protein PVT71_08180 [Salipiger sp. H15]|uniref:Alpha/beta hydrolase n=1 Tax=Alloyangia sp. H15 TaxID=3029062 RepID=A0AAU8AC38_9RHOB
MRPRTSPAPEPGAARLAHHLQRAAPPDGTALLLLHGTGDNRADLNLAPARLKRHAA